MTLFELFTTKEVVGKKDLIGIPKSDRRVLNCKDDSYHLYSEEFEKYCVALLQTNPKAAGIGFSHILAANPKDYAAIRGQFVVKLKSRYSTDSKAERDLLIDALNNNKLSALLRILNYNSFSTIEQGRRTIYGYSVSLLFGEKIPNDRDYKKFHNYHNSFLDKINVVFETLGIPMDAVDLEFVKAIRAAYNQKLNTELGKVQSIVFGNGELNTKLSMIGILKKRLLNAPFIRLHKDPKLDIVFDLCEFILGGCNEYSAPSNRKTIADAIKAHDFNTALKMHTDKMDSKNYLDNLIYRLLVEIITKLVNRRIPLQQAVSRKNATTKTSKNAPKYSSKGKLDSISPYSKLERLKSYSLSQEIIKISKIEEFEGCVETACDGNNIMFIYSSDNVLSHIENGDCANLRYASREKFFASHMSDVVQSSITNKPIAPLNQDMAKYNMPNIPCILMKKNTAMITQADLHEILGLADAAFDKGDYARAVYLYTQYLGRLSDVDFYVLLTLAEAFCALGKYDMAMFCAEFVYYCDRNDKDSYIAEAEDMYYDICYEAAKNAVKTYFASGVPSESGELKLFGNARDIYLAELHVALIEYYIAYGKKEKAEQSYNNLLKLGPFPETNASRSSVSLIKKQIEELSKRLNLSYDGSTLYLSPVA